MNNPEARRCLLCRKPSCSLQGCPVRTPVPEAVALYREDRIDEAGELLFANNPLSAITSRVCDWKKFCYGHCILNAKQIPVRWYEIEQEISGKYLFEKRLTRPQTGSRGTAAIVGAGPAGLTAAIRLHQAGVDVTLYDARPRMGGVMRYGIPPFRLERRYVDAYERLLGEAGIPFHGGRRLGRDLTVADLAAGFGAVLIACGAEDPARLGIPGEDRPSVLPALGYLADPARHALGRRVIVIGGGNVALDAARTAVRTGAETWVYYRKTFENMPANPFDIEEAQREGVRFAVFQAPVAIEDGSVLFRDCENVSDDGRIRTRILPGTDHRVPCDTLIPAIGERPDPALSGIPLPSNVFTAGDFARGPRTIVEAVASAREAADHMLRIL